MNGYEQALIFLAIAGCGLAVWALFAARNLERRERDIAETDAARHPAE